MISMDTWEYFLRSIETFQWAIGHHFTQLNTSRISIFLISFVGEVARVSEQCSKGYKSKSPHGGFMLLLFNMISI